MAEKIFENENFIVTKSYEEDCYTLSFFKDNHYFDEITFQKTSENELKKLTELITEWHNEYMKDILCNQKKPKGNWILEEGPDGTPICFHCSNCDIDFSNISIKSITKYCPDCGIEMNETIHTI